MEEVNYIVSVNGKIQKDFVFPQGCASNEHDAKKLAVDAFKKAIFQNGMVASDLKVFVNEIKPTIIDKCNGLDKKLVNYVNFLYVNDTEKFKTIIIILVERDVLKFANHYGDENADISILDNIYSDENWEVTATDYLGNIADNTDLETIINYCRYFDKETKRQLFSDGWLQK